MKFNLKIIIWIAIFSVVLCACSGALDLPNGSVENTSQPTLQFANTLTYQVITSYPDNTPSPTFTVNPIYTAIFRIVTITNTPTLTDTPTITPTPTRTLKPTSTRVPTSTRRPSATSTPIPNYLPLINHVFNNVKVYSGDPMVLVFTIVGGSEECPLLPSGRGVYVKYPDGRFEWKDRNELIQSGRYFVQDNDPNIQSSKIDYLQCPSK
jgi:hypothetical protein